MHTMSIIHLISPYISISSAGAFTLDQHIYPPISLGYRDAFRADAELCPCGFATTWSTGQVKHMRIASNCCC
jgi:hypothetical protein